MKIEVTVPLQVVATMSFLIDDKSQAEAVIKVKIAAAQRELDRRGNDPDTGIYMIITGHDEPLFDDA